MYCRRCGKFIDGSLSVCNECVEEMLKNEQNAVSENKNEETQSSQAPAVSVSVPQAVVNPQPVAVVQPVCQVATCPKRRVNVGKARAIWSVVLSGVAILFLLILANEFIVYGFNEVNYVYSYAVCVVYFVLPECIISIVFGAKSIVASNKIAKQTGQRPMATMICGIIGLAVSVYVINMAFILGAVLSVGG